MQKKNAPVHDSGFGKPNYPGGVTGRKKPTAALKELGPNQLDNEARSYWTQVDKFGS